jgi:cytochrome c551/c552
MPSLLRRVIWLVLTPVLLFVMLLGLGIWPLRLATVEDYHYLAQVYQRDGAMAVVQIVDTELFGVDASSYAADPSYGRVEVAGRGRTPWVVRGNLDGQPRMLKLALAPSWWAAYDLQHGSLYQVWRGDVLFEGAVYDYRHGPQPVSTGEWVLRNVQPQRWFLRAGDGEPEPAEFQFLGYDHPLGSAHIALRYRLSNALGSLILVEEPALQDLSAGATFTRGFRVESSSSSDLVASYAGSADEPQAAVGDVAIALRAFNPIAAIRQGGTDGEGVDQLGDEVIADRDCLSCHNEQHRVVGPSWVEVAQRYAGEPRAQVMNALVNSIREGGAGRWGEVPMTPHPALSEKQLHLAVDYILAIEGEGAAADAPKDAEGKPYVASRRNNALLRPNSVHPSYRLENLAPPGFEPKVGGMAQYNGLLYVATWDADGAVYRIDPKAAAARRVQRIAEGLHEPLGLEVVDGRLFVLQKQELTELIDRDGDGAVDRYRTHSYAWPANPNFHSFSFGLVAKDKQFYLLSAICILPGGASCPGQEPTQGKLLRIDMQGQVDVVASGFRTPNGIGLGPERALYVTDNQGDWLPASKLVHVESGKFYGSRTIPSDPPDQPETPPALWLPQDEVGNSPTQPLLLDHGVYAGQMLHGDVFNGGLKRAFLETVAGVQQGAVFHFSGGLAGGVNRLQQAEGGVLYLGEVGNPPNWGEFSKLWYGLEQLTYQGNRAFELLSMRVRQDGFMLTFTQPLAADVQLVPEDILLEHWFYHPTAAYGGPKYDHESLQVAQLELAADRRSLHIRVPGLSAGYVVYLRLPEHIRDARGTGLWTREAWYTLNALPLAVAGAELGEQPVAQTNGWEVLFDGQSLGQWRNYGGSFDAVRKWTVEGDELVLRQDESWLKTWFGSGSTDLIYAGGRYRDFELELEWQIAPAGNSGIFYLVADERADAPWRSGLEMQVLDNEAHYDRHFDNHRAGSLYDLVAASPETVRPAGEWNQVRIKVHNNHIEHWLNGQRVVSIERDSERWQQLLADSKFSAMPDFGGAQEGYIVLQDHGDVVRYRNIRIRSLTP